MASLENFRVVVFRAVAEQLSFHKAAEELYLTQPAVSIQIKALEEDLGVQLFNRTGAHITLTDAGRLLLNYAEQVKSLLVQAEHEIAALTETTLDNWRWERPRPSLSMCYPVCWASSLENTPAFTPL